MYRLRCGQVQRCRRIVVHGVRGWHVQLYRGTVVGSVVRRLPGGYLQPRGTVVVHGLQRGHIRTQRRSVVFDGVPAVCRRNVQSRHWRVGVHQLFRRRVHVGQRAVGLRELCGGQLQPDAGSVGLCGVCRRHLQSCDGGIVRDRVCALCGRHVQRIRRAIVGDLVHHLCRRRVQSCGRSIRVRKLPSRHLWFGAWRPIECVRVPSVCPGQFCRNAWPIELHAVQRGFLRRGGRANGVRCLFRRQRQLVDRGHRVRRLPRW